jgi:alpha-methylacyl-CoA racemase
MSSLKGLKILDFTRLLPGPLATMFLANMGAEVIKIENPKFPDNTRQYPPHIKSESASFMAFNHDKKSVLVDYTQIEGQEIILKFLENVDILIEQFRPNFLTPFGLDYHTLHQKFPKLIYVSLTGYGQTGEYAHLAGHDLNYVGLSGLLGGNQNSSPMMPIAQIADIAGGSYLAMVGCLSALYARTHTGQGQHVDIAMLDATIPLSINAFMWFWATGENPPREEQFLAGKLVNYNIYKTKDDKYMALGALEEKFWKRFCEKIEKNEWKNDMYDFNNTNQNKEKVQDIFLTQNADFWVNLGLKNDIPLTLIQEINEVMENSHIKSREIFQEIIHPKAGNITAMNFPIKFSETPHKIIKSSPILGENTQEYLKALGISENTIKELLEKKIIISNS